MNHSVAFRPNFGRPDDLPSAGSVFRRQTHPPPVVHFVTTGGGQALIEGPGFLTIDARVSIPNGRVLVGLAESAEVRLRLAIVGSDRRVDVTVFCARHDVPQSNGAPVVAYRLRTADDAP